ncbi:hypothetical protein BVC80_157g88 [Macleaya cordata]|uniref:Uncharacterized protein n=1 Tax=Macleaya cordata TaxID=56857 RepID=A0A200RC41_MACCD|nr:hypothetical protein BVC80_157g88 [Macleaya cordata]
MEIEELMEGSRYVVKIRWRRGCCFGVTGHVQRVIEECSEVTMTSILLNDNNPDQMLTTAFVKVKEDMKMTEEELHHLLMNAAARFGLLS